jgi:thioredoxin reductase (NADPH)
MRAAIAPIADAAGLELREIDVDSDRALEERWGDRVPVLLGGEREICHYRLDAPALDAFLAEVAPRRDFG